MPYVMRDGRPQMVMNVRDTDTRLTLAEFNEARLALWAVPRQQPVLADLPPDVERIFNEALQEAEGIQPPPEYKAILDEDKQAAALAGAASAGFGVIHSDKYTLLLDIDGVRDDKHFTKTLTLAQEIFPDWGWSVEKWDSRSGNTHIKVSIPKARMRGAQADGLGPMTRIALEVALGSDRTRGLLGLARVINGLGNFTTEASVLFRPGPTPASQDTEGDEV